jgi:serine/threonine-protein kinase
MRDEDRIADLLLAWEDEFEQGRDISAEELCKDSPELVSEVRERIESLKRTRWLLTLGQRSSEPPPTSAHQAGQVLAGRFRLDKLVGTGGFGEVWQGFDVELQRTVAVKVPKPSHLPAPEQVEDILAEARKVASLQHPGIVSIFDVGREGDFCFLVSEYVEGGSLADLLARQKVSPADSARFVAQIAEALHYAHQQGFIHRDVKAANVLIDHHGRALLCDFGIAVLAGTSTGPAFGSLRSMSPEQLFGDDSRIDHRSDIYALGVLLYELLTGQSPFSGNDPATVREKILHDEPPPPRSVNRATPAELERICLKCLAKSPANRYQTAQALATDLARYAAPRRGASWLAWVGAGLLMGGIVAGMAFWNARPQNEDQAKGPGETKATVPSFEGVFGSDQELFNGKDLTEWVFFGAKARLEDAVKVEDGVLICNSRRQYRLRSEGKFGDFRLRLAYRFPVGGVTRTNGSAILLRMTTTDDGAQDYLRIKFGDWATGRIVLPAVHASQTKEPALNPRVKEIEKPAGEWNDLDVVCLGKKVMVMLNGEPMNELDTAPENEGWLAIAPQGCDVQVRSVKVAKRVR